MAGQSKCASSGFSFSSYKATNAIMETLFDDLI